MAADEYKCQLSIKSFPEGGGERMLNIRGSSAADLIGELDTLANMCTDFDSAVTAIGALEALKSRVPANGASAQYGGARPAGGQAQGGQNTAGRGCIHGPMTYRTGSGAKGPWQGWFCPRPKGDPDACKPVFQNA